MSEPSISLPSSAFQVRLEEFERSIKPSVPEWLRMTLALWTAYCALSESGQLSLMFDRNNTFDMALLVWCHEGENRDNPKFTHSLDDATPFPSVQFQRILAAAQKVINAGSVPERLPNLLRMGASLAYAYRTLNDAGLVAVMFDQSNPFDLAMRLWCVAAEHRSSQCNPLNETNLARN